MRACRAAVCVLQEERDTHDAARAAAVQQKDDALTRFANAEHKCRVLDAQVRQTELGITSK